jgi:hypothetical protein
MTQCHDIYPEVKYPDVAPDSASQPLVEGGQCHDIYELAELTAEPAADTAVADDRPGTIETVERKELVAV